MSLEAAIKNAALTAGAVSAVPNNSPPRYADKQFQYFAHETAKFVTENIRYATDFVLAKIQGLEPNDPNSWGDYYIRMADVVHPGAAMTRKIDNYKQILFEDPRIEYLRTGTKIQALGSYWLAVNPMNLSTAGASGIIQRCNAVWNYLDYYGNVISEPIIVENARAGANDSDYQSSGLVSKGYFNIICQYNEFTAQINTNTRVILGSAAWRVTGYADFRQGITGDYDSVRLLEFTVRYDEPNVDIDDMANHVAGGKTFSWDIPVSGVPEMIAGQTAQFTAVSERMGKTIENTDNQPITYTWASDNEEVAMVDSFGAVTALGEGTATITATLEQNCAISGAFSVTVSAAGQTGVSFTTTPPTSISAYNEATLTAAYFEGGEETDNALSWEFSGADSGSYSYIVGPKSCTVYCFSHSTTPLTVTVGYGDYKKTTVIALEGV